MYEELARRLRDSAETTEPCCECPGEIYLFNQAADAIEELNLVAESNRRNAKAWADTAGKAAEQIPRWVPVAERLPEERIPVLVCFDFKGRKSVDVAELWSDGGFHNYSDEYLTPEGSKYRKGTHWMPLPEPPKEET